MDPRLAQALVEFDTTMGLDWIPIDPASRAPAQADAERPPEATSLAELERLHADTCVHCTRVTGHRRLVFGEGSAHARLMFVGEAPGADEDREGRPFVGRAGELLGRMIEALGLSRGDVYIANVLKARPPENRNPTPEEAALCGQWLHRQIDLISPAVIVALGAVPMKYLLETSEGITNARGRWGSIDANGTQIAVMPTFHPAYVLRQYTPEVRGAVWSDLQAAHGRAYPD